MESWGLQMPGWQKERPDGLQASFRRKSRSQNAGRSSGGEAVPPRANDRLAVGKSWEPDCVMRAKKPWGVVPKLSPLPSHLH